MTTTLFSRPLWAITLMSALVLTGCKPKTSAADATPQEKRAAAALAQPATEQEIKTRCISIERAIDIADLVETSGTAVKGLREAGKVDEMMVEMGYVRSAINEIYQVGRATIYTQGCDADEMGSMVNVSSDKATLVAIAGAGQPATAPLVSISMTDEEVWNKLRHEMGALGFQGPEAELSNGHGYKIFADRFLSGNGFVIHLSREQ